jgi:hypothetical protein
MIIHFLDLAEQILAADENVIVPVKKLWLRLQQESPMPVPPLDNFTALLRADGRFEFLLEQEDSDRGDLRPGWTPEQIAAEEQIMEELGFFRGPRVKLVRVELTRDLLMLMLTRHLENLTEALKGAWELRPEGDEIENQLGEIWEKAMQLKETIDRELGQAPSDR